MTLSWMYRPPDPEPPPHSIGVISSLAGGIFHTIGPLETALRPRQRLPPAGPGGPGLPQQPFGSITKSTQVTVKKESAQNNADTVITFWETLCRPEGSEGPHIFHSENFRRLPQNGVRHFQEVSVLYNSPLTWGGGWGEGDKRRKAQPFHSPLSPPQPWGGRKPFILSKIS
jgi:hypothetical protein